MTGHPGEPGDATLIDISVLVNEATPEWPGDTPYSCRWTWDMARGDSVNVSCISSSPHVGTHADAPFHVDPGGSTTDALPISVFSGPARVVDVSSMDGSLPLSSLGGADGVTRLLLRTGRTIASGAFPALWPWLDGDTVEALVDAGLRLLGVDAPSVDAFDSKTLSVHKRLFERGAYVLENLDLRHVAPGDYQLTAYPLKVAGLDAAPVRAVLRRLELA
jgi:arylformamidase